MEINVDNITTQLPPAHEPNLMLYSALVESRVTKSSLGQKRKIERIYEDISIYEPQNPNNSSLEVLSDICDLRDLCDSPFQFIRHVDHAQSLPKFDLLNVTTSALTSPLDTQVTPDDSPFVPKNLFNCAASPSFGNDYSTPNITRIMHTSIRFSSPLTPSKFPKKNVQYM